MSRIKRNSEQVPEDIAGLSLEELEREDAAYNSREKQEEFLRLIERRDLAQAKCDEWLQRKTFISKAYGARLAHTLREMKEGRK